MDRRKFLRTTASLLIAPPLAGNEWLRVQSDLRKVKITGITGFQHECPRPKLVGKNSHLDVHGRETRDTVLRIFTDRGIEGIGAGRATAEIAGRLIGHTVDEYWRPFLSSHPRLRRRQAE
jgi:hypothetical protein